MGRDCCLNRKSFFSELKEAHYEKLTLSLCQKDSDECLAVHGFLATYVIVELFARVEELALCLLKLTSEIELTQVLKVD